MIFADQVLFFFEDDDTVGIHVLGEVGNLNYPFTLILPFEPEGSCAGVCLRAVDETECPGYPGPYSGEGNLQNCYNGLTAIGEFYEGDGECGTDQELNNCDPS